VQGQGALLIISVSSICEFGRGSVKQTTTSYAEQATVRHFINFVPNCIDIHDHWVDNFTRQVRYAKLNERNFSGEMLRIPVSKERRETRKQLEISIRQRWWLNVAITVVTRCRITTKKSVDCRDLAQKQVIYLPLEILKATIPAHDFSASRCGSSRIFGTVLVNSCGNILLH
jgi:hypothetical protein